MSMDQVFDILRNMPYGNVLSLASKDKDMVVVQMPFDEAQDRIMGIPGFGYIGGCTMDGQFRRFIKSVEDDVFTPGTKAGDSFVLNLFYWPQHGPVWIVACVPLMDWGRVRSYITSYNMVLCTKMQMVGRSGLLDFPLEAKELVFVHGNGWIPGHTGTSPEAIKRRRQKRAKPRRKPRRRN